MERSQQKNSGLIVRAVRIWSGLILLVFVTSHLLNLSLGLISIEAMDAARPYLSGIWASPILGPVLLASLISHFVLGLWTIYRRPILRTSTQDLVQLIAGVMVVPLLAIHALGVAAIKINEIPFGYGSAIQYFWLGRPSLGLLQVVMLSIVWIHGCAGLFIWLRSKESMRHLLGWIYPLAVAVPVLALFGFAEAGRSILIQAQSTPMPAPQPPMPSEMRLPFDTVASITKHIIWWSLGLALLAFVARNLRIKLQPNQIVSLRRGDAAPIKTTSNLSVLDGFMENDQPHAGLCAGRGRCGTCAIRIVLSEFPLPEPTTLEQKTLRRIGADPDIRLACQLVPSGGLLEVDPIYPADYSFKDGDFAKEAPAADQNKALA